MLGLVAMAGIGQALLVGIRRKPDLTPAAVTLTAAFALVSATLLAVAAYVLLPDLLGPGHAGALNIARVTLLLTYLVATGSLFQSIFAGRGQFMLANLAVFQPHLIHAVFVCVVALAGRLTVETAIACMVLANAASHIALAPLILKEALGPLRHVRAAGAALWSYGHRAIGADLLTICSDWSDRLLLIVLLAPRELGLYVVAYGFSRVVAVATPTNGLLLSAMAASDRAKAKQMHDLSLRFCLAALAAASIVALALSEPLIRIFYGQGFLPATAAFRILVLQATVARIAGVTSVLYMVCDRPGLNSLFSVCSVAVSVVLMVVLTPIYGAPGAAAGLLTGALIRLALLWIGMVTHLRVPLPQLRPSLLDLQQARMMFRP
jgi:O-antigen/teichoic acid export membrane protein